MSIGKEMKALRLNLLLSQEDFAKELGVSYSSVNRWERERTRPNYHAMKLIDEYCKKHNIDFDISFMALEEYEL